MRRSLGRCLAGAAITAGAVVVGSVGSASATAGRSPATDGEVRSILEQVSATGTWGPGQRSRLLTRPDLAATLVDPISGVPDTATATQVAEISAQGGSTNATLAYATRTKTVDRYINYFSITGGKVLEYHFVVTWKYDGAKVTATPTRSHYVNASTWYIYDRGFTSNSATPTTGAYAYTVTMQGLWEQCLPKLGCVANNDPWTKMGVYKDGTYNIQQRA